MSGWVFMRHPETGGENRFPDSPDVVTFYEARGWVRADLPADLDPDAPDTGAKFTAPAPVPEQPAEPDPIPALTRAENKKKENRDG